jgi:hypothetical protein
VHVIAELPKTPLAASGTRRRTEIDRARHASAERGRVFDDIAAGWMQLCECVNTDHQAESEGMRGAATVIAKRRYVGRCEATTGILLYGSVARLAEVWPTKPLSVAGGEARYFPAARVPREPRPTAPCIRVR